LKFEICEFRLRLTQTNTHITGEDLVKGK